MTEMEILSKLFEKLCYNLKIQKRTRKTSCLFTLTRWYHFIYHYVKIKVKESEVAQSCPTLCDPMDCSLPDFSVYGIFQARVLEWGAISFSRGSSWPRDRTQVSCIAGRCVTLWDPSVINSPFPLLCGFWLLTRPWLVQILRIKPLRWLRVKSSHHKGKKISVTKGGDRH